MGKIELLSNLTTNYTHQNVIEFPDSGILQFKSGKTMGSMCYTISTYEKNFESSITIIAEKGTIKIGGQYLDQLVHYNVKERFFEGIDWPLESLHKLLYKKIVHSLKNSSSSCLDAENSIETIDFIDKAPSYLA